MQKICLGLIVFLHVFSIPALSTELDGLPVASIVIKDSEGKLWPEPDDVRPLLMIKEGDFFSREAVRKGIEYVYLKKQFRDIRVEAFPDRGGVRIEYTLFPVVIVDRIVLRGNHSLSDQTVLKAMAEIVGKELREEAFADIRTNIKSAYEADGYYNVKISFRTEPSPVPFRAVVFVYITEPNQTIIEEVGFKGNTVFLDKELIAVMKNRPGEPLLTNVLFEHDLDAIRKKYADAGFPAASPGPVRIRFEGAKAFLEVAGDEGPKVTVLFRGNRKYCEEEFPDLLDFGREADGPASVLDAQCAAHFRDTLLIWSEHDVSDAVIESSVDKIRNLYRDKGYADVKVEVKKDKKQGSFDIVFTIDEGERIIVDKILIEGNTLFSAKQIRAMMATKESGLFVPRFFREDVLDRDVEAIADRYAAAGYLGAEVKRTVVRAPDGKRANIHVKISEGQKTVTGAVIFEGNKMLSDADLSGALKLIPGLPYSDRKLEEDRYRILSLYASKGYLYASVEAEKKTVLLEQDGRTEAVNVRFNIIEDKQVRIGTVILRGNISTRDYVILRELEPKTGEPYSYESILKSQQRVYRYRYFNQARFEPVHPYEKEEVKDMLFTVEERPAGAVEFGAGYGDLDRLRGFLEVSHRNIWGRAHYSSLRIEGSDILRRASLTYQVPWFLGIRSLDSKLILAWSDSTRLNQDTREIYYQTRKTTASYGVERTVGGFKTSMTYQFENVENYNVQPAAELSPEDSGRVLISSLSPAVVWDLRDDPFNPHRGGIHGVTVKQAMSLLGSEANFTKAALQTTWYIPAASSAVVALSARAGMAWPHQNTSEIPIHERFYLGGGTTVRGYTQDSVGPQSVDAAGNLVPTGGSSMAQLNAEVRLGSTGGFGVVFFTDAGNVWVDRRIRPDDLRASYGMGFRYHTPVGPLRIDYGQKIHRRSGESPGELHFNIGQAF